MAAEFLVPWEVYSADRIFENLPNIEHFAVVTQFPQFVSADDRLRQRLADRMYEELYSVVKDAKLGRFEEVQRFSQNDDVGAKYSDDDHQFIVSVRPDLSLVLQRPGSSFERFYKWYKTVMPHFEGFVTAVQSEYQAVLNSREGSEIVVVPTRAQFIFKFILFGFKTDRRGSRVKNSSLLSRVLTNVPGSDGALVAFADDVLPDLGRVDLKISRWNESPSGMIREVYNLEAPSNRNYGALWAEFSYIAETGAAEEIPRLAVDFASFFRRIDLPINEFLQGHCLKNFLGALSEGVKFETSSSGLP